MKIQKRMKKKSAEFSYLLILLFLITSYWKYIDNNYKPCHSSVTINRFTNKSRFIVKSSNHLYKNHSPIIIDGNDEFLASAETENWVGNGTKASPYLIDGLNIQGSSKNSLLDIRNTDVHFQISNCLLDSGYNGIDFRNVTNSLILNNIIRYHTGTGVYISTSSNNSLLNNTIINNWYGVFLSHSEFFTISHNSIANNSGNGIEIETTPKCSIIHNIVTNNRMGIWLDSSFNATLTNNIITNNTAIGISITGSNYSTIMNNTLVFNGIGIRLGFTKNLFLINNKIVSNRKDGLFLWFSRNNVLFSNIIANNTETGISLENSWNNNLTFNTIINNTAHGILLSKSGNNVLLNNTLIANELYISGDQLEEYLQKEISNNSLNGKPILFWQNISGRNIPNGVIQIILINSSAIEVNHQTLNSIQGAYCSNLYIHDNLVTNGSEHGISFDFSENITISSNIINDNAKSGIYLRETFDSNLKNNEITHNGLSGIQLIESESNKLEGNIIDNNNFLGISLLKSGTTRLLDNELLKNGVSIEGTLLEDFSRLTLTN
ncbi:MAG: NosD domain-containing protein, partial [Candidatus Hodarchaeales archaeon]